MRILRILSLTAFVLLTACGNKSDKARASAAREQQPQEYPTLTVRRQPVTLENTYPVLLKGQEDIEIRPRVDGFIEAIYIDEGSPVRKGQRLFTINSPAAVQGVATAQASVVSAEATLATAQINVERMRPLSEKGIISNVQLRTYENQYEAAQASLNQAQADLRAARATLSWTTVTSPVDGVAGTLPYRQGSLVSSSNVLTTVANTTNIFAYFSLNEKELLDLLSQYPGYSQAEKIAAMPEVTLTLADGNDYTFKGKIETISGVVDTYTGSANFRAEFPNPAGMLRSGMSGTISIPRAVEDAFEIPQKATFAQQDKILVYKVQGDSVVQAIITVQPTPDGQNYAVTGGLSDGDRIVSDGVATLSDGKKITTR